MFLISIVIHLTDNLNITLYLNTNGIKFVQGIFVCISHSHKFSKSPGIYGTDTVASFLERLRSLAASRARLKAHSDAHRKLSSHSPFPEVSQGQASSDATFMAICRATLPDSRRRTLDRLAGGFLLCAKAPSRKYTRRKAGGS